jgi:OmpA-OmpF porin, OOP family
MALFCVNCGTQLREGSVFCVQCGARVESPATPSSANSAAPPSSPSVPPPYAQPVPMRGVAGPMPVPSNTSGKLWLKLIVALVGLVMFATVLGIGSCLYVGFRLKKKADQVQQAYKSAVERQRAEALGRNAAGGGVGNSRGNSGTSSVAAALATNNSGPAAALSGQPAASPAVAAGSLPGMGSETERTVNGPEADLLVRIGAVSNFGFGWPNGFDPFSGNSTPSHAYPWTPPAGSPSGLKRILIGSAVTPQDLSKFAHDGYSDTLSACLSLPNNPCKPRVDSLPVPIIIEVGTLPSEIHAVLFQIFVDDFQAPVWHSHFQVSLNGTRIPSFEAAINSLDQTGPIGKLLSLNLLPEYWPLLQTGTAKLLIDDPSTHAPDGYAIDFVRILVNPRAFKYQVSLQATVVDADKHSPISGATVSSGLGNATTDNAGRCKLSGLPAGLVTATASAPGYDQGSAFADLVAGQTGTVEFQLRKHQESTAALEQSIAQTGSATVYGIHFDTDSAKLRPDSAPALAAILGLIRKRAESRWIIAGHTDNSGAAGHNQKLSEARAASVVSWLTAKGVPVNRLAPQGFGATRPVADNATPSGRALNRRVEISPAR